MSSISLNCEHIERIPNLAIAQQKFLLSLPEHKEDEELKANFLDTIRTKDMAPWYKDVCKELNWPRDEDMLNTMTSNNELALTSLNEQIENAQKQYSNTEVRDAYLEKAKYLSVIGDKNNALKVLGQAFAQTVAVGYKMDNVLTCVRIGFFFSDHTLIIKNLSRAEELAEMGIDYDKRNRLKIYKGLYGLMSRDYFTASCNFVSTVATFACNELLDYTSFIRYTVYSAIYTLTRPDLKKEIIENSNVLQALHRAPEAKEFVFTLYNCEYGKFFKSLANIEKTFRENYLLHPHYQSYVRELKVKAYLQFLVSYKSLSFDYMAKEFEVTSEYIEEELRNFIAIGKLCGKIDKVNGVIVLTRGIEEKRTEMYNKIMKQSDLLLNRMQRLTKILDSSI